jgi:hypothetical protein
VNIYLFGAKVGGTATKMQHLIYLLKDVWTITVVFNDIGLLKNRNTAMFLNNAGIRFCLLKDLPDRIYGTALVIYETEFFRSGAAENVNRRGLKLVFSNEMMWAFKGEAEAVKAGLIDKVLFVSDFQAAAFAELYQGIPSAITGNYVAPEDFQFKERRNSTFTIGRLSRPDPGKYPEDFPVFYEELDLKDVQYRDVVLELYDNYPLRRKIARQCGEHARENICSPDEHRRVWINALTL